ncbi:MAG TPA: hypothetical protein DCY27_05210 [Desulfobacterales bacterium]|nr:hypothetical protein [Desulfobacterales bacterium]
MDCVTIKAGQPCNFMTKKGCSFNGGRCHEIIDKCEGCDRILETESGRYCAATPNPEAKWRSGTCNLATHVKNATSGGKTVKINPIKASKRGMRQ